MNLESQVCSLELAKRLKELGVKQESIFYFNQFQDSDIPVIYQDKIGKIAYGGSGSSHKIDDPDYSFYSAFSVAELGEMLPYEILDRYLVIEKCFTNLWQLKYTDEDYLRESLIHKTKSETEADARAKILIYLIENKLIKEVS